MGPFNLNYSSRDEPKKLTQMLDNYLCDQLHPKGKHQRVSLYINCILFVTYS